MVAQTRRSSRIEHVMKTLGVIANPVKDQAGRVLVRLAERAVQAGIALVPDDGTAALMGQAGGRGPAAMDGVDAIMVLGGDGTLLRAVQALHGRDVPIIGVNLGGLGFMTSVAETELERAVDCLARDEFGISQRTMLECRVASTAAGAGPFRALNDVVMTSMESRVATLRMQVDGQAVGDFVCDGVILSTPTGSTGHSLSAGGPLLMPEARALVVSLICPHTLSTRPLVLPDDVTIEVTVVATSGGVFLTADGQVGQSLAAGDRVVVRRDPRGVRFIHLPGYSYFGVLRQKLHWRGSNV